MSYIESINDSLSELAKHAVQQHDNPNSIVGTVVSIDTSNTCTVQPQDTNKTLIRNVLLSSDTDGTPMYVPALGSQITVTLFGPNSGFVAQQGAVNTVALAQGANSTDYGGLCIVGDVVTRLNNIENLVNGFIAIYNAHTHAGVTTGSQVTAVPAPLETNTLTPTVVADIENVAVTHGSGNQNMNTYQTQVAEAQAAVVAAEATLASLVAKQNAAQAYLETSSPSLNPVNYKFAQQNLAEITNAVNNAANQLGTDKQNLAFLLANPKP